MAWKAYAVVDLAIKLLWDMKEANLEKGHLPILAAQCIIVSNWYWGCLETSNINIERNRTSSCFSASHDQDGHRRRDCWWQSQCASDYPPWPWSLEHSQSASQPCKPHRSVAHSSEDIALWCILQICWHQAWWLCIIFVLATICLPISLVLKRWY